MERRARRRHQPRGTRTPGGAALPPARCRGHRQRRLEAEVLPLDSTLRDGTRATFAVDEHSRRTSTLENLEKLEALASLKPLHAEIEGFSITTGNAAGINDGAAAVVMTGSDLAAAEGLEALVTVRGWASVGVPPALTGLATSTAIPTARVHGCDGR